MQRKKYPYYNDPYDSDHSYDPNELEIIYPDELEIIDRKNDSDKKLDHTVNLGDTMRYFGDMRVTDDKVFNDPDAHIAAKKNEERKNKYSFVGRLENSVKPLPKKNRIPGPDFKKMLGRKGNNYGGKTKKRKQTKKR